jgi:hypothetical protein
MRYHEADSVYVICVPAPTGDDYEGQRPETLELQCDLRAEGNKMAEQLGFVIDYENPDDEDEGGFLTPLLYPVPPTIVHDALVALPSSGLTSAFSDIEDVGRCSKWPQAENQSRRCRGRSNTNGRKRRFADFRTVAGEVRPVEDSRIAAYRA